MVPICASPYSLKIGLVRPRPARGKPRSAWFKFSKPSSLSIRVAATLAATASLSPAHVWLGQASLAQDCKTSHPAFSTSATAACRCSDADKVIIFSQSCRTPLDSPVSRAPWPLLSLPQSLNKYLDLDAQKLNSSLNEPLHQSSLIQCSLTKCR